MASKIKTLGRITNGYLDHRYGTCKKGFSPIQHPGLDQVFCSGCQEWIAAHYVLESHEPQQAEIAKPKTEPAKPEKLATKARTKSAKPAAQVGNSNQLSLMGGAQ